MLCCRSHGVIGSFGIRRKGIVAKAWFVAMKSAEETDNARCTNLHHKLRLCFCFSNQKLKLLETSNSTEKTILKCCRTKQQKFKVQMRCKQRKKTLCCLVFQQTLCCKILRLGATFGLQCDIDSQRSTGTTAHFYLFGVQTHKQPFFAVNHEEQYPFREEAETLHCCRSARDLREASHEERRSECLAIAQTSRKSSTASLLLTYIYISITPARNESAIVAIKIYRHPFP